jgi:hypothetical protein
MPPASRNCSNEFKLEQLFNELGWDRPASSRSRLRPMANPSRSPTSPTSAAWRYSAVRRIATGKVPARPMLLKIEKEAAKLAHEHLLVFADAKQSMLTWLWVSRAPGQPTTTRTHTWHKGRAANRCGRSWSQIVWSLEEEEAITLTDVITGLAAPSIATGFQELLRQIQGRARSLRRFHRGARRRQRQGLVRLADAQPADVRLLHPAKGFLDGDENYLANRMAQVQASAGKGKFHSFYRQFLRRLFHEGLGAGQGPSATPS